MQLWEASPEARRARNRIKVAFGREAGDLAGGLRSRESAVRIS
jgi:hypothetical protein